jgi:hypothetical protein
MNNEISRVDGEKMWSCGEIPDTASSQMKRGVGCHGQNSWFIPLQIPLHAALGIISIDACPRAPDWRGPVRVVF